MATKQPTKKNAAKKPETTNVVKKTVTTKVTPVQKVTPTKPVTIEKPVVEQQAPPGFEDNTPADERFDIRAMEKRIAESTPAEVLQKGAKGKNLKVETTASPVQNQNAQQTQQGPIKQAEVKTGAATVRDEDALQKCVATVEDALIKHTAGLHMSKSAALDYAKKSYKQYQVSIADDPTQAGYSILTFTFGQHKASTKPIKLHA